MEQESSNPVAENQTTPAKPGSLPVAVALAVVAAAVGAVAWAAITYFTNYQIGWMAVGVGFLVGYATRMGRGTTFEFRLVASVLALLGCVAGNYLTLIFTLAKDIGSPLQVFAQVPLSEQIDDMVHSFQAMDLLFYGIAVYEGWLFAVPKETA
jgi:hypothetical protein